MFIRQQDLVCVRAKTVGELLDELAQADGDDWEKRYKMRTALGVILVEARNYFADENGVCRGALTIAATAIEEAYGGFIYNGIAGQLTNYIVMLANEMLHSKGAGYWSLETLVELRKVSDAVDVEDEDWPDDKVDVISPRPEPVPEQQPQAAE